MSIRCWSEHGAFRAAFLERFRPEDRPALQKAGAILAGQVVSGDRHHEPFVVSEFQAALTDARMLADYLRQIAEEGVRLHAFGGELLEPRESLVILVPTRSLNANETALLTGAMEAGYRAEP